MEYVFTSLVGLVLLALFFIHGLQLLSGRIKKLPPGPTPLPIIGNLHLLGKKPHESMAKLAKIHGPIMLLRFGFVHTVMISSSAMAKEVLKKQGLAFTSRTIRDALLASDHSKYSVMSLPVVPVSAWRSLRKVMNNLMFSASRLEANQHLRSRKVDELIARCRLSIETGEAVDIGRTAFETSINMLSDTIFSKDLTDSVKLELREIVLAVMQEAGKSNFVDFFPFLAMIDPQGVRRKMDLLSKKMIEIVKGLIDERLERGKSEIIVGTTSVDVFDLLLDTINEGKEELTRTHIERLIVDIFLAGADTTSSTVEWGLAEAIKNPDAMKRAKVELEEVIGKGKIITEEDIARLPFLRCMVKETLRLHPAVPLGIRKVHEDVQLCGYTVPKNTQVFLNYWAIGRDADTWPNPHDFKPERFLESQVDVYGTDFEMLPFGSGRRICPGLNLAVRSVPVMLGSLLNSFDWKLEGGIGCEELDMEEKFGFTLQIAHPLRAVPVSV